VRIWTVLLSGLCIVGLVIVLASADDLGDTLKLAWLSLFTAIASVNFLFPVAKGCSMTYAEYQDGFLADGDNSSDRFCRGHFTQSNTYIFAAVAKQATNDFKATPQGGCCAKKVHPSPA
jgi:hypothetical protein